MRLSLPRLITAAAVAMLMATTAPATAQQAPAPEPNWQGLRSYQVWHDELPERLDPAQVEVVVLSPDERCKPPGRTGPFGLPLPPLIDPTTQTLCRQLEAFVQAPPEPLPLPVRLATQALSTRQPAAIVAALQPAPQRRYVALVAWHWQAVQRDTHWLFEEAVLDRETGRWIWHAARAHDVLLLDAKWTQETARRTLHALLRHELPRDLLGRNWWRDAVPLPGSRWVPAAEMATWQPGERAGLALLNSYNVPPVHQAQRAAKLWPAGTPEPAEPQGVDWSTWTTVRSPQATPLLPTGTLALLDLPPGAYAVRVGTAVETLRLEPGRVTTLHMVRPLVGNSVAIAQEPETWWRAQAQAPRWRHAFQAQGPAQGSAGLVPWFQP